MKPLIVLITAFSLAVFGIKIFLHLFDPRLAIRIGMSVMLIFTAMAHFAFPKGMVKMIPDFIPFKPAIVYVTGIIEIAAAIGLHILSVRVLTGWLLIIFFILVLPTNIFAAMNHIDYQKGTPDGKGLNYLWFRIPLQALFIVLVYISLR